MQVVIQKDIIMMEVGLNRLGRLTSLCEMPPSGQYLSPVDQPVLRNHALPSTSQGAG